MVITGHKNPLGVRPLHHRAAGRSGAGHAQAGSRAEPNYPSRV